MMSNKRLRVRDEKKRPMNPVKIITNLPKDLQAYLKTFLIGVRYPLIFRVEGPSDDPEQGRDVYQCSVMQSPWDADRFCFRRDNTRDFPQFANDWTNKLRIPSNLTVLRERVVSRIADEFVRARTLGEEDASTDLNELSIHSHCCAKHRVPFVLRSDLDKPGDPVVAGHAVTGDMCQLDYKKPDYGYYLGSIPLAYGEDADPDRGFVQLLTLFGENLDQRSAATQMIDQALSHWTRCSEDMYDCVDDVFKLE